MDQEQRVWSRSLALEFAPSGQGMLSLRTDEMDKSLSGTPMLECEESVLRNKHIPIQSSSRSLRQGSQYLILPERGFVTRFRILQRELIDHHCRPSRTNKVGTAPQLPCVVQSLFVPVLSKFFDILTLEGVRKGNARFGIRPSGALWL